MTDAEPVAYIRLTDLAVEDLQQLAVHNPLALKWALKKMLLLEENPNAGEPLLGGLTGWRKLIVGDREWRVVWVLIGPRVTLSTAGHPVELDERYDFITHAAIVIEDEVWIGAAATITPGVTIGRGSVVGAGAVVAKDVPPMTVVTGTSVVERRRLKSASGLPAN